MAAEAKISALIRAADVNMEPLWPGLLAKALTSVKLEASSATGVEDIGLVQPLESHHLQAVLPALEERRKWKKHLKCRVMWVWWFLSNPLVNMFGKKLKLFCLALFLSCVEIKGCLPFSSPRYWENRGSISKSFVSLNKGFRNRFRNPGQSY